MYKRFQVCPSELKIKHVIILNLEEKFKSIIDSLTSHFTLCHRVIKSMAKSMNTMVNSHQDKVVVNLEIDQEK